MLIVIDGLDGCGKATQTALLKDKLIEGGKSVTTVSFPDYESESSAPLRMYLRGDFGQDPNAVNPYAAGTLFAIDRYASYNLKWKEKMMQGDIILCDRYTTSNIIHQMTKLDKKDWDGYIEWNTNFEYNMLGIPAPDIVIYLSMDISASQKLLSARYEGDESKKDIHEQDLNYLESCRAAAEYAGEKLNWKVVKCSVGDDILPIDDIKELIYREVEDILL